MKVFPDIVLYIIYVFSSENFPWHRSLDIFSYDNDIVPSNFPWHCSLDIFSYDSFPWYCYLDIFFYDDDIIP